MKKLCTIFILTFLFAGWINQQVEAQCTNTSAYGSATAPTSGTVTFSTCSYQSEYSTLNSVVSGITYSCAINIGGFVTIRSGSYNGPVVAYGNSPLTWTATTSGTHYCHWNTNSSCGLAYSCVTTTCSYVSGGAEHCYSCPTYDFGPFTPSTAPVTHSSSTSDGTGCRFYAFNVISGVDYTFTTCSGGGSYTGDSRMILYNSACSELVNVDDFCGVGPQITWTATYSGTAYVRMAHYGMSAGVSWILAYWRSALPGDNCANAQNLASLTSPYSSTTVGYTDDLSICRTGYPDRIFYLDVLNGGTIEIWESVNSYDEYEYLGYGSTCPGTQINCWDNDVLAHHFWTNSTGSTQTIWYIQDAYSGSGTFTLNWTLTSPPACIAPGGQTATNITIAGADLGWTSVDSFFDIFVDVTGAPAPGASTTPTVDDWNGGTPYTWSGGSPSTTYDWYIRTDCAAGGGTGQSDWTGPNTFATICNPLSIPHTENFDSGVEWPACWSETGNTAVWQVYNNYFGLGTGYQAYADYSPYDQGILHSPEFDGTGKNNLHVRFLHYWRADYSTGNQDGYFYGSPDGGTTPYLIDEWHHLNPSLEFAWKEYDISAWADGASNITFWWDLDMYDDWYWVFDYFTIQEGAFGTPGLWTGAVDNNWHTSGNWDDNTIPFANISVVIPTGLTNYPTLSAAGYCYDLYMYADASGYATLLDGGFLSLGGTAYIQSYITADVWHFIGSPVTGATADVFKLAGGQPDVYLQSFDETTNTYTDIVPVATPLNAMEGYAVWVDGLNALPPVSSWTFTYPGTLHTGSYGAANNMTRTIDGDDGGNNLLSNPYPSGIDWDAALGWTKTNMMDAFYIEDAGGWATYVGGGPGIGTGSVIAPGQGFFVFVNDGGAPTTGTLMMNNSVRVHTATPFLKDAVANLVRLEVQGNNKTDETVIRFLEDATALFDGQYDAFKLEPTDGAIPQIYSVTDKDVAINSLPATDWVQLGFKANFDGEYTISAIEINDLSSVWLEDTFTSEFTNLTLDSYSFIYSVLDNPNRFILHFTPLAVPENFTDMINIYSNNHDVYVSVPANTNGDIVVYNLMGQEVARTVIKDVLNKVTLNKSAYYVVKVLSNENVVTKKVFVK